MSAYAADAANEAMSKVTGSLQKSTEIMKLSNSLIKLPQISQTMREMSMEMTKVGGILGHDNII